MYRLGCRHQKPPVVIAGEITHKEYKALPNGFMKEIEVSDSEPLPSVETTDLETLIAAGVPLNRVNSKIAVDNEVLEQYQDFVNNSPME